MDLLRGLAPDIRVVLLLADVFCLQPPVVDLRERTDAATAEHILNQAPAGGPERTRMLDELEAPVIARAVEVCRAARDAWGEASAALRASQAAGAVWADMHRERASHLAAQAVRRLLEAHAWAEEAEGVARAIGFARRGEAWEPRDHDAETDALIAIGQRQAG
jgi:hypothetical protein